MTSSRKEGAVDCVEGSEAGQGKGKWTSMDVLCGAHSGVCAARATHRHNMAGDRAEPQPHPSSLNTPLCGLQ